jgi:hypothetical protein
LVVLLWCWCCRCCRCCRCCSDELKNPLIH